MARLLSSDGVRTTLPLLEARRNQSCPGPPSSWDTCGASACRLPGRTCGGGETWDFTDAGMQWCPFSSQRRSPCSPVAATTRAPERLRRGPVFDERAPHAALPELDGQRHADGPASDDDHLLLVPGRRLPGERRSHPHRHAVERKEPKVCASRSGGSSMGRESRASPTRDLGSTRGSDRRSERAADD
jgi:hypothetical protein